MEAAVSSPQPPPPAVGLTRIFRPEFRIVANGAGIRVVVTAREASRPQA